jgi:endoglucanase
MHNQFFMKTALALTITLSVGAVSYPHLLSAAPTLNNWWPTDGARVSGVQPFKAVVDGEDVSSYDMYWQVDGGSLNLMPSSYDGYPHKEVSVDVSGWKWRAIGPYQVTFVAKRNGTTISQKTISLHTNSVSTPPPTPVALPPVQPLTTLFTDPNSSAAKQALAWTTSQPGDAAKMRTLAAAPTAKWFGEWSGDVRASVASHMKAAGDKTAVLVAYNIPQRDCGGYSAGGTSNYLSWITAFANGIGSGKAIVILEPDALSQITCLSGTDQAARLSLLSQAVDVLKKNPNTKVYIDAGHSGWNESSVMATRLKGAGIARADGFSLNVSNYNASTNEVAYGTKLSSATGGKHFVIDTSRNGNGSNGEWCNAWGRSIGNLPTTNTGVANLDAYLWIKTPGESDGTCNGGPPAGTWWPDYAVSLVR